MRASFDRSLIFNIALGWHELTDRVFFAFAFPPFYVERAAVLR